MRLLVTGASGLLGINLALGASAQHEVIAVDRRKLAGTPFKLMNADLLAGGAVDAVLDEAQPDWVIHCAALANLEDCEADPYQARRLNAELPGVLAAACRSRSISLVHISTDAVFDGTRDGAYTEQDEPHPRSVYAATKLDGENAVLGAYPDAIVARVNFYGWSPSGKRSLAEFFFNNLSSHKPVSGFTDVIFCPMFVTDLAGMLLSMLEKKLYGLYHAVGPQAMSKYQFGVEIARKFGLSEADVSPKSVQSSGLVAQRSHNLWLSSHKLSTDLGRALPDFSTGLDRFYTQFKQGYPQKIRSYQQIGTGA
jgi:dTDP-4-dehydrorhamnose reductase